VCGTSACPDSAQKKRASAQLSTLEPCARYGSILPVKGNFRDVNQKIQSDRRQTL
jgi:hypothetical protein